jgi:hypothetical protein
MHGELRAPTPRQAPWEKVATLTVIVGLHGLLLLAAATMTFPPQVVETLDSIDLRVIDEKRSALDPEKTKPSVPRHQVKQSEPLAEPPVLTAAGGLAVPQRALMKWLPLRASTGRP